MVDGPVIPVEVRCGDCNLCLYHRGETGACSVPVPDSVGSDNGMCDANLTEWRVCGFYQEKKPEEDLP